MTATKTNPSVAMVEQIFAVEGECHGWRLDQFLQKKIQRLSRERIQRVIRGDCWVDGMVAKPSMRVRQGQRVVFHRPAPPEPSVPRSIDVCYEDPWFYAIEKPAGLPMHPTAKYHLSTLTAVLREVFPTESLQIAHRLDRETSGLLLVARHKQAGSALKTMFAQRAVQKRYLAIVQGQVKEPFVRITQAIGPDAQAKTHLRMAIVPVEEGGLPAETEIRPLVLYKTFTLVECFPKTGRQHQIRVHLASIGHPIVGDKLYPDESIFLQWADHGWESVSHQLPLPRHALHAAGLSFVHPHTGVTIELQSALPADLQSWLDEQSIACLLYTHGS